MAVKLTLEDWRELLTPEKILNYTNVELAKMFNVSRSKIIQIKNQLGLSGLKKKAMKINWEEVFELYDPLVYTSTEIAGQIGCNPVTVRKAKAKLGLTREKLLKKFLNKRRLETFTLEEIAHDLNMTPNGVSKAIKRIYKDRKRKPTNSPRFLKPRVLSLETLRKSKRNDNTSTSV